MRQATLWLASIAAALWFAAAGHAQQRSLLIERMDVELRVNADATVDVTERFRIRFDGSWNGLRRDINTGYADSRATLSLADFRATDGEGRTLRIDESRGRDAVELRIWVPGAEDATRDVVLHYRAENALRFFPPDHATGEHDELYWNVTGNAWEAPIADASATVLLPAGAAAVRALAWTGAYRDTSTALPQVDGETVRVASGQRLEPGEGLTVAVAWAPGLVDRSAPSAPIEADAPAGAAETPRGRDFWPLLLPVLGFFVMYRVWRRFGDDPPLGPIVVRYEPPRGLSPAEVGYMHDEALASREVAATLIDLAVRGHIAIEEEEKPGFLGIGGGKRYTFVRRTAASEWSALKPHEREVLVGLFGVGGVSSRVELEALEDEFHKTAAEVKSLVSKAIVGGGHYDRSPTTVRAIFVFFGLLVGVALGAAGIVLAATGVVWLPAWLIATGLTALIVIGFGLAMPRRTQRGLSVSGHAKGLHEFLSRVESDRYERTLLTPEMFDKLLPYAIALGVEERWGKKFEGIMIPPRDWYHGARPGDFTAYSMVQAVQGATTATTRAMAPPGGSSSGSGFGGG
ncbi:MAG: DUF2207 domain-containing protein, partial [Longimicrobiales bacterium]